MERLVKPLVQPLIDEEEDDDDDVGHIGDVTPLMIAARDGRNTEIRRLLAEGADVNAKDSDGDTALQWAEADTTCLILLEAGADVTLIRRFDTESDAPRTAETALMAACESASLPCILALMDLDADVNYVDPQSGMTPLMEALRSDCDPSIIDQLLGKGANIFAIDNKGWNAFMWYAEGSDNIDVMRLLLEAAGPAFRPKTIESYAIKKIQSVWRGWKVRRQTRLLKIISYNSGFMRRMMTVI